MQRDRIGLSPSKSIKSGKHFLFALSLMMMLILVGTQGVDAGIIAECKPGFSFLGILADQQYGVNDPINNITVILTEDVANRANLRLVAQLFEEGPSGTPTELKRISTITDNKGQAIIDFNYAHPRTGPVIITVTADPDGEQFKNSKTIEIARKLDVILNCPSEGFIQTPVTCSWKVEDAETGELTTANPTIEVLQGGSPIDYTPGAGNTLQFTPIVTGGAQASITVEKQGYILDTDLSLIQIQDTTIIQKLKIDNQDYLIAGDSLETGVHQITLAITENNLGEADINSVNGVLKKPNGQSEPITFSKGASGWTTSVNLIQPGSQYVISGEIIPEDISLEPILFEYQLISLGSSTESDKSVTSGIIITAVVVGALIFILIIVILFFVFRGGRKRR